MSFNFFPDHKTTTRGLILRASLLPFAAGFAFPVVAVSVLGLPFALGAVGLPLQVLGGIGQAIDEVVS